MNGGLFLQVQIKTTDPYITTYNPQPIFIVDFGQKVTQFDPLQLFNISGTDRCIPCWVVDPNEYALV